MEDASRNGPQRCDSSTSGRLAALGDLLWHRPRDQPTSQQHLGPGTLLKFKLTRMREFPPRGTLHDQEIIDMSFRHLGDTATPSCIRTAPGAFDESGSTTNRDPGREPDASSSPLRSWGITLLVERRNPLSRPWKSTTFQHALTNDCSTPGMPQERDGLQDASAMVREWPEKRSVYPSSFFREAWPWVCLEVLDNGVNAQKVLERLDPMFSTKAPGRGTARRCPIAASILPNTGSLRSQSRNFRGARFA